MGTIKYNQAKIAILTLYVLYEICCCYTESDKLSNEETYGIISHMIPKCNFGVESVSYFLYTRDAPYGKVIKIDDDQIPIHANKPVAFLIHGFMSEANNSNHFELITAWLQKDDINIFSLDWSDAACDGEFSVTDLLSYNSAVKNVPIVSEYLTNFTIKLVEEYDVRVDEILVIGHSLGAHVAGLSGKSVQGILKQKYKQIIGLDPAGPEFNDRDCAEKLCNSDAAFVQVFHTSHFAGINYAIGDADFYFNGGNTQPGCILTVCSHSRAVIYLTMILLHPPCFIGTAWTVGSESILDVNQCEANICTYFGLDTFEEIARGVYYVNTTDTEPFCIL